MRFQDERVAAVFDSYPKHVRAKLLTLRALVLDTAAATAGVGKLEETLKWGQPSYLTTATKSGSTIRIAGIKDADGSVVLYFNCQTSLVETFRELYPKTLRFEANRAIVLDKDDALPIAELRHCIALALTYHRDKRARGK